MAHRHRPLHWLLATFVWSACSGTVPGVPDGSGGASGTGGSGGVDPGSSPCDLSPCENGGACHEDGDSFWCHCPAGFAGDTCGELLSGLIDRPDNPACVAPVRLPGATGPLVWEQVPWFGAGVGLMQTRQAPDGSWYEIFRYGDVYRVSASGVREDAALLTIPDISTSGELGLLGFDLHPDYPAEPYFFFYYATNPTAPFLRIERYTTTALTDPPGSERFIDGSAKTILTIEKNSTALNHNGGTIEFSPVDAGAVLYLATGEGGGGTFSAQEPSSLLGKLLRIDVTDLDAAGYTPEIIALGLRNPFRWAFDSATGDIWIGDVGQGAYEEVDFLPAGAQTPVNFGWPYMEGFHCYAFPAADVENDCDSPTPLTLPVHEYDHSVGVSVVGGRVYRGTSIPGVAGRYFFADYFPQGGAGNWILEPNPDQDPGIIDDDYVRTGITPPFNGMVGYAEDRDGELYVYSPSGYIYKLVANDQVPPPEPVPDALSDTGCFDASGNPSDGLIPYETRAPLWSDGAAKQRWMAIADGGSVSVDARGDFHFPPGSVLVKEFSVAGMRVETRLLMRHPDGGWAGYSYAWIGEDGTRLNDGLLLPGDSEELRPVLGTGSTWAYPSRGQCFQCHTEAAGITLGLESLQLNSMLEYPSTDITGHQLFTLSDIGVFAEPLTIDLSLALPLYDDDAAPLVERVWSYLHSNCAGCHQPGASGHGGRSAMPDLRYDPDADRSAAHPLEAALCNVKATSEDLGLDEAALLVSPGVPGDWSSLEDGGSVVYLRMAARPDIAGTSGAMPQIGTRIPDDDGGLALVAAWIRAMACP